MSEWIQIKTHNLNRNFILALYLCKNLHHKLVALAVSTYSLLFCGSDIWVALSGFYTEHFTVLEDLRRRIHLQVHLGCWKNTCSPFFPDGYQPGSLSTPEGHLYSSHRCPHFQNSNGIWSPCYLKSFPASFSLFPLCLLFTFLFCY